MKINAIARLSLHLPSRRISRHQLPAAHDALGGHLIADLGLGRCPADRRANHPAWDAPVRWTV